MQTLGLIGGIGSGKSTVAALFARLGAGVVDVDAIGHRILRLPEVGSVIEKRWGTDIFTPSGEPDRKAIAAHVFSPTETGRRELEFLTALTHPLIQREIVVERQRCASDGPSVVVLDAALLLETDWKTDVDQIVFVEAPREVRLRRVLERGWTETQLTAREATQLPLDFKRAKAHWHIDNAGDIEKTFDEVKAIWQNLVVGDRCG